jgi:hypothetical protein
MASLFADRRARRAYLLTKAGVLVAAGVATWPLSHVLGARAWTGFAIFAAILATMTVVVLAVGSAAASTPADEPGETADDDEPPHPDEVVVVPVEDALDLHPFPPADVPDVVADYLEAASGRGFSEVRLIHGRGIGVQRERVRSLLGRHPLVVEFHDAPPERGGWGATVARLRDVAGSEGRSVEEPD